MHIMWIMQIMYIILIISVTKWLIWFYSLIFDSCSWWWSSMHFWMGRTTASSLINTSDAAGPCRAPSIVALSRQVIPAKTSTDINILRSLSHRQCIIWIMHIMNTMQFIHIINIIAFEIRLLDLFKTVDKVLIMYITSANWGQIIGYYWLLLAIIASQ